jgi:dihydroxyacetone kinase
MTRIVQDPATFTDDMLAGFAQLHSRYVLRVPGGVVRAVTGRPKVAVVVGGGSGHYPAFCGLVGPGFADGAVVGNVFTSPSGADAVSVGRAADTGAGVLLITGNYAGDVLHFRAATDTLRAGGIDARYLVVTDDIASASPAERANRRGIAGGFTVFKAAAAAAEAGYDLDEVVRTAERANEMTRTLGVAFDGCTLPGAGGPLFTVPAGRMALGLGIHGEPGVLEQPMPSAAELAALLVDKILDDAPAGAGRRLAVILNGLGATKYEELFLLWRYVAQRLRGAGYELCEPEVGELVTSLDMAGCSVTVTWLDEELERFWRAPADTPAYRKGQPRQVGDAVARVTAPPAPEPRQRPRSRAATAAARACAGRSLRALEAIAETLAAHSEELGRLDAVAGDGDHGRGMVKGSVAAVRAAREALADDADAGDLLSAAGEAWAASAGGTSGALWGVLLDRLGLGIGGGAATPQAVSAAVGEACAGVTRFGGAAPGDKTMVDALVPFAERLASAVAEGQDLSAAWAAAAEAARRAAEDTRTLLPRLGRARPLAQRSLGHADPGATSFALCTAAVLPVLALPTPG